MGLILRRPTLLEMIQLHDFYSESKEPDAPSRVFSDLNSGEQEKALNLYNLDRHFTVLDSENTVGFLGLFPDEDFEFIHLFYLVVPEFRGKGFLTQILNLAKEYCQLNYSQYHSIRALTLPDNIASVKGLQRSNFTRSRSVTEELASGDVQYEEYLLPLQK